MKSFWLQDFVSVAQWLAAAGCALMGGVFFAFSTFVMKALARLPAEVGIAAMQSINITAVKSWFLIAFLATAASCGFVMLSAFPRWGEASAPWLLAGSATFLAGTFLVTMLFNVPLNNALAALPENEPDRAAYWVRYVADWTAWNHVRTLASFAAAALLVLSWMHERKIFSGTCPEADSSLVVEMKRNNNSN